VGNVEYGGSCIPRGFQELQRIRNSWTSIGNSNRASQIFVLKVNQNEAGITNAGRRCVRLREFEEGFRYRHVILLLRAV
jgi:hypothetical protein